MKFSLFLFISLLFNPILFSQSFLDSINTQPCLSEYINQVDSFVYIVSLENSEEIYEFITLTTDPQKISVFCLKNYWNKELSYYKKYLINYAIVKQLGVNVLDFVVEETKSATNIIPAQMSLMILCIAKIQSLDFSKNDEISIDKIKFKPNLGIFNLLIESMQDTTTISEPNLTDHIFNKANDLALLNLSLWLDYSSDEDLSYVLKKYDYFNNIDEAFSVKEILAQWFKRNSEKLEWDESFQMFKIK